MWQVWQGASCVAGCGKVWQIWQVWQGVACVAGVAGMPGCGMDSVKGAAVARYDWLWQGVAGCGGCSQCGWLCSSTCLIICVELVVRQKGTCGRQW
jgi:hypothetical protein